MDVTEFCPRCGTIMDFVTCLSCLPCGYCRRDNKTARRFRFHDYIFPTEITNEEEEDAFLGANDGIPYDCPCLKNNVTDELIEKQVIGFVLMFITQADLITIDPAEEEELERLASYFSGIVDFGKIKNDYRRLYKVRFTTTKEPILSRVHHFKVFCEQFAKPLNIKGDF